ncbi:dihydrodipicolinate synthase family protein [Pelagovum pacificum]|uniref:Dihydrodipicolinate synthase family protein n=1 Tax=Pelagovum pacificum TaxID=2588711 RepID=A0A5C5G7C7_9RHOB|nr:dihydrodipicolinate synthase family protein [Pelagovum pacificum]QQA41941.1 dihydrodipicolinate synthase family protein [Pelagovum pacificum]TNY30619.1 dihydrodipicolinate synthase family protein [Pelagovum pacificum]
MHCTGLWPPAATPFRADLSVDTAALVRHCETLLADGASGLAPLGTTSEANSLTLEERREVLDALLAAIPAKKLMPGTGACALGDAIALSGHAARAGCAGVLLLPPFFYKGVGDDGLYEYVARVIDGVSDDRLRVYLYHIPQMAGVGWSLDLIARLRTDFPDIVVGLKDSSGDWDNTSAIIEANPGFAVFPANEAHLSDAIPLGAAGCISATANVNAGGISSLIAALQSGKDATELQKDATHKRLAVTAGPLIPGIKALLGLSYSDADWSIVRPPLTAMGRADAEALQAKMSTEAMTS